MSMEIPVISAQTKKVMHNPKTDPKVRKPASTTHPAGRASASTAMIEACDRLGQKLDEVADLFREQIEAWWQIQPPESAHPAARENADHRVAAAPAAERPFPAEQRPPEPRAETGKGQPEDLAAPPSVSTAQAEPGREQRRDSATNQGSETGAQAAPAPPRDAGAWDQDEPQDAPEAPDLTATAAGASHLVDTLARTGGGWPEQAAGVQQALESIMAYLENQAATAAPTVDVAGIMSRLKDLEEQQQTLQSQFNVNRWGP
jgi:hypothetical protein